MALPSGFRERLEQMEQSRNQLFSLLQAEKEVQSIKSQVLASKISGIKSADHRCLKLEQQIASQRLIISSLKSEIDALDSKCLDISHQFRDLKGEVQELEELKMEKEKFFDRETKEMEDFRAEVGNFAAESGRAVDELRKEVEKLKSNFVKLQSNIGCSDNTELAAAEMRKSRLLAEKENLNCMLVSNYQIRAQIKKQLQSILVTQSQGERNSAIPLLKRGF